jgi:hypothetical protein
VKSFWTFFIQNAKKKKKNLAKILSDFFQKCFFGVHAPFGQLYFCYFHSVDAIATPQWHPGRI